MLVFGTEMHVVTFIFVVLEMVMLICQLLLYFLRPRDGHRKWYLVLLVLLIIYNITGGLFPDPKLDIPLNLQYIIAYGSGFVMASYFPLYFYKAFDLKLLRFHALYGVPLFLLLPYLVFFVFTLLLTGDLHLSIRYGMIAPFFYSIVLLWAILRAIRTAYRRNRNHNYYLEEIMVYCAVAPWASMTIISYFEFGQLTEVLFTNLGFIAITTMFIFQAVKRGRLESLRLSEADLIIVDFLVVDKNCKRLNLSIRECEVVKLVCERLKNREIAEKLFISERTVEKHIENMFAKTGAASRLELIEQMNRR